MWVLSPEPEKQAPPAPQVEDLLSSEGYIQSDEKVGWLRSQLVISQATIIKTAKLTEGQRENPMWGIMRKLRITASNFGPILHAKTARYVLKYK